MPEGAIWMLGGSWRRQAPDVGDLDVMVVTETGTFAHFEFPSSFVAQRSGEKIAQGDLTANGDSIHVDFWSCTLQQRGAFAMFLCGPKALNIQQRALAATQGLVLSQYGLFDQSGKQVDNGTEIGVYSLLGIPWLRPVDRQKYVLKPPTETEQIEFQVPSDTDPTRKYTIRVRGKGTDDEFWSCTCLAYKYTRAIPPTCKHIQRVRKGVI